jgi:predicted NUDIX family NTP pyrophosphohydrolase
MARKQAAGTVLYRISDRECEVLLVHPSGAYNRRAPWSIPKGVVEADEDLEAAARRETEEETGVTPGELYPLGHVDYQKSWKRIHGFAGPAPEGASPRCASWEIDRAEFLPLARALELIHPDQAPLLERLRDALDRARGRA